jgi:UDP-N-acetyl-D-mannosaminuronate dehydrogenase
VTENSNTITVVGVIGLGYVGLPLTDVPANVDVL